jgi:hypothetical protein
MDNEFCVGVPQDMREELFNRYGNGWRNYARQIIRRHLETLKLREKEIEDARTTDRH